MPIRGATIGVVRSCLELIGGGATHVGVACDHVIESFRNDLWPGYKTSAGMPRELLAQFGPVEDALRAAGFTVWPMVEVEADDALASAAAVAAADERVDRAIICTPDKDLGQCVVDGRVWQWDRRQDKWFDEAGVRERLGVDPESVPDLLAVIGDSADGFPGPAGLGRQVGLRRARPVEAPRGHPRRPDRLGRQRPGSVEAQPHPARAVAGRRCCSGASPPSSATATSAPSTTGSGRGPADLDGLGALTNESVVGRAKQLAGKLDPLKVALALGSGGARGYAHIGAIQVLEERGLEIAGIAGSSMGALVGGVHAAGKLPEYTDWATSLTQFEVLRLLDLSLTAPGVIRAEKVFAKVKELVGSQTIEELPIPYTAIATDLLARKEVWFQRGPLDVAIRASIAIPSIITPVVLNGRLLTDGGLLNPVPIAPVAAVRADVVVAVSLHGDARGQADGAPAAETAEARPIEEWGERFRRGAARVLDSDAVRSLTSRFGTVEAVDDEVPVEPEPGFEDLPAGLGRYDMMNLSIEAMQSVLQRYRFAGNPPDVLVSIPKDACRSLDFHRAADMVELGRTLTTEALDAAAV